MYLQTYIYWGGRVEFEWDAGKAHADFEKHGIDFYGAIPIFETVYLETPRSASGKSGGRQLVSSRA